MDLLSKLCTLLAITFSIEPVNYCKNGEGIKGCKLEVSLYVNRLNTEVSLLPYEYDHFDFCIPPGQHDEFPGTNLGQVLLGDRICLPCTRYSSGRTNLAESSVPKRTSMVRQLITTLVC